ncbi:nucleotide-binding alpha-beta plait domain-containing protein [Artemisia annua]|uniref:Nucleotide-binding alpha-beta plait domain-containing protein n=1 Tax=Artemisia annua TaxID=35608 RepID=A0A2U1Q9W2_ARTAN|nr:nucleotide-binding alpha-beta plait domain-containing protein [Artemisia annua]
MERRQRNPIPETIQRRITKLFVTNLPEGCSGSVLAEHVRPFGKIFGLYIARKRDKGGNRFGFISMLDVEDKGDLLKSLRNIRLGENKLWFNIARFVLEDGEINTRQETTRNHKSPNVNCSRAEGFQTGPRSYPFFAKERSFKDSLVGKKIDVDSRVQAFSSLHGKALVAKMVDMQGLKNIKVILRDLGPGTGKVHYLGGLDVLLSFEDSEVAEAALEIAKSSVDNFASVTLWSGQSLAFERIAWLKIKGIPLHLLTNDVIDNVGQLFGKVVHNANKMESDQDLSYAIIGVLLWDGKRIDDEVILNWNNQKFRVWVAEEFGEWIPDFVEVENIKVDNSLESDSDESFEDQSPENVPGDNGTVVGEVNDVEDQPFFVTDIGVNEALNDIQSFHNDEGAENEENIEDTFMPGVDFPFEDSPNGEEPFTLSKVNKRKKFKKQEVGRPSYGYVSSQESLKNGKKPKSNDPFGLDKLLGLNNKYSALSSETQDGGALDLNIQPGTIIGGDTIEDVEASQAINETEIQSQAEEVLATIVLGEKLGTDLSNCNNLIMESINHEGLQRDKR